MAENKQDVGFPITAEFLTQRMLGARLYLHILLRWVAAAAIIAGALVAHELLGVDQIRLGSLIAIGVAIAGYNAAAWVMLRKYRDPQTPVEDHEFVRLMSAVMLMADYLALTAAIWLTGGARSPFLAFYLLHV